MLVGDKSTPSAAKLWLRGFWISFAVLALSALSLAPHLTSSMELVRMRNALLLADGGKQEFDWNPGSPPADFMLEKEAPYPEFTQATRKLGLHEMTSDWERALAISRHLLSYPEINGPPIQSDLIDTYHRIVNHGEGYCSDFVRVFMAFAIAEGIPVRPWSFSLDGFGGHGHIWPEIWNRQLGRWQLLDVYNNFYFHGPDGVAISALELKQAMMQSPISIERSPLHPKARLGYESEDMLWDYYRRGLHGWYMQWGNNVFTYDRLIVKHMLGRLSRALEQFDALISGVTPRVKLLADDRNQAEIAEMWQLRTHLLVVAFVDALAVVMLFVCLAGWAHARKHGLVASKT